MMRKTACAAAGIALACAAGFSVSLLARSQPLSNLDLRWMKTSSKQDRLPTASPPGESGIAVAFDLQPQATSLVTRMHPQRIILESAVQTPRPVQVLRVPARPLREVPPEEAVKKERLPEGCEPAFSPVTTPAFAHIGVRCDS
ncbi:hypothetical protein [Pseudorhodoplanes sp.]|uniref:hypothetical protein n=1 Tax=Pseudorhodoplanes sp. TaxID=1934341 RepID=UPI002C4CD163|nr:hypothetical protein [Pseudorhodoplanes sp.]HWV53860.1 hypothetical protein [Pseudorhodoplanes sp.]